MIQKLAQVIKSGTKFFIGHGDTNDTTNRQSVGEIVGSFIKEIGGKVCNVIIGHFPEKEKVIDMDVCSMEADVYTDDENVVGDINEISGIALGSSNTESPAFPGALRLGTVQCFESATNPSDKKEKIMTFDEVKKAVRDMNIHPWQLYTIDDLKNDREFSKMFTEIERLKNENKTVKEEKEKIEKDSKEAIRTASKHQAQTKLDELLKKGFTDKQKEFIKSRFNPETMDELTDEKMTKFVEDGKKEFAAAAKLFGVPEEGGELQTKKDEKENEEEESSVKTMEDKALETMGVKQHG